MATRRIKDITNTATTFASDDFIALDGATQGTRKMDKDDLIAEVSAGVSGDYLEEANNLSDVASLDTSKLNMEIPDVGTAPNEVPLNGMLGDMAYQSSEGISVAKAEVETLEVTDKVSGTLNISTGSPEAIADADADDLVIGDGVLTNFGATIATNSSGQAKINFADGAGANAARGQIKYDHQFDKLSVSTAGGERVVVDEYGRVGVGTASPSAKLHLQDTGVDVGLSIDRTDAKKFNIYVDSGGNLITRDQGAGVSRVVVLGNGDVHYQTSSAELALYNDLTHGSISRAFVKCEGRSGTFNYGGDLVFKLRNDDYSISERARFTQNGLCFNGDTAAANALDAYEEGLWSATFTPATSGTITLAGSVNALRYTIVGRVAHIQGKVDVTAVSSPVGNYVKVSLPTAVGVPDINEESGSTAGSVVVIGAAGSMNDYTLLAVEGDDHLRIYKGTGSTPVATAADFNGNEEVYINATYIVA